MIQKVGTGQTVGYYGEWYNGEDTGQMVRLLWYNGEVSMVQWYNGTMMRILVKW